MAEKTVVPRAELVGLLGLSPDVSDEELQRELAGQLAAIKAAKEAQRVSAAEQRARAEDRGLVVAAHNDGRLSKGRIEFWCDALRRDREGNRAVLASLAPGPRPSQPLPVDPGVEAVHAKIVGRLAKPATATPPQPLAAAAQPSIAPAPTDGLGLPIPAVPAPVCIARGKDPQTWTYEERSNFFMHKLGPRLSQGVPPPPPTDRYYQPSPNDPYEWVETGDGHGEFRPKSRYQAGY
jgi:hypothetical protein